MKSVKNTIKGFKANLHSCFNPYVSKIKKKLKLKGRTRLANRYARKHPKRVVAGFFASMLLIISADIVIMCCLDNKNEGTSVPFASIYSTEATFQSMRNIQTNKENIRLYLSTVIEDYTNLNIRLDSLNSLENKTHKDSVEMKSIISKLRIISNTIPNEEN